MSRRVVFIVCAMAAVAIAAVVLAFTPAGQFIRRGDDVTATGNATKFAVRFPLERRWSLPLVPHRFDAPAMGDTFRTFGINE